jgi:hypothetical protein
MLFIGAAGGETVNISANGDRLTFFRQPANITMDTHGVEIVDFDALGGSDNVTVGDLSGTDVRQTNIDLAPGIGVASPDLVADNVVVNGTEGDDNITVANSGSTVDVTGLATAVAVEHPDALDDSLSVNTLGGNDNVFTGGVGSQLLNLFVDGVPTA